MHSKMQKVFQNTLHFDNQKKNLLGANLKYNQYYLPYVP